MNSTESIPKTQSLIIFFFCLIFLWLLNGFLPITKFLWFIGAICASLIIIIKNKNVGKRNIIIGVVLGGLAGISNNFLGLATMASYIGARSIFKKSNNQILLLKKLDIKSISSTVLLALVIGIILGVINLFLGLSTMSINFNLSVDWLFKALTAGISEEIIFRFLLFAICILITKDKKLTRAESFMIYVIMIIPHVLMHFDFSSVQFGSVLVLSVLFGLPFSLLQRKHDLLSAMGSHFLVDLIRFWIFSA